MAARTLGKWVEKVKGLYEKRGWFYYQLPTPKDVPPGTPRPKAVALKTRSFAEVVEKLEKERHDIVESREQKAGTMEDLLPAYHRAKAGDAKVTRLGREHILKGFMDIMGTPRVADIDRPMIETWRKHLLDKGGNRGGPLTHGSLETYSIALRAFLIWAVGLGYAESNPLTGMKIRVGATRVQDFLTEAEREKLLAERASEHIRLILHLGFFAGLRDGEMLALNPKWIWISDDKTRGTITVQNTPIIFTDGKNGMWQPKGRKKRSTPMHPRLLECLLSYPPNQAFFPPSSQENPYFNSLRYTDAILQRIIDATVQARQPVVMLYTSDHGEYLNDYQDGFYDHGMGCSP